MRTTPAFSRLSFAFACSLLPFVARGAGAPAAVPENYKLLYSQDFSTPSAINDFVMADPKAWVISGSNGQTCLQLVTQSHYRPGVRSPFNKLTGVMHKLAMTDGLHPSTAFGLSNNDGAAPAIAHHQVGAQRFPLQQGDTSEAISRSCQP